MSRTGDWYAPPETMTSRSARTVSRTLSRDELDAHGAVALEDDALDEDVRADLEIGPVRRRMEERVRRAAAHAVPLRELEARDPLGLVDVQVLDVLYPASTAASSSASMNGDMERLSDTERGPPTPWNSSGPRSLSSDRLKYGSTSS